MDIFIVISAIALALLVLVLAGAYICFYIVFYRRACFVKEDLKEYPMPEGDAYSEYHQRLRGWIKQANEMPHDELYITSFDGLKLHARYYEYAPDAPIEVLIHGYRGNSKRDLSGGIFRCLKLGRSAFVVDNRAAGLSEGKVTTFGVNEMRDCLAWVDYIINNVNRDAKIILTGVSMGAATVMLASGENLPKNVVGILADSGFTSAEEIIKKVMKKDMNIPPNLLYPFVKLGALLYGRFNLDKASPKEALKKCTLPIIFIHGDGDTYVPYEMSMENYKICTSENKRLLIVKGAEHCLSYPTSPNEYMNALGDIFGFLG